MDYPSSNREGKLSTNKHKIDGQESGIGKHRTGPSHLSVPWSSWEARLEKLSALTFLLLALIGALVNIVRILSFALIGALVKFVRILSFQEIEKTA